GTKMLCGVVADDGTVPTTEKKKTKDSGDTEDLLDRMVKCVGGCMKNAGLSQADVQVLGVAAPGPIDVKNGVLKQTPNLAVRDYPLAEKLAEALGFPVVLENDVNAGLYGEYVHGGGSRYNHVVGLFPGTGMGGAMILDGALYRGAGGAAGEIGHMIVDPGGRLCGCGKRGCLESVASRGAIAREAAVLVTAGKAPTIAAAAGADPTKMKSGVFREAVDAGEQDVIALLERAAWWLGLGMANCVNIFNPEAIIVGGGLVEKLGSFYMNAAEASMREHAMDYPGEHVQVISATLGDNAAIVGAAIVGRERSAGE
ncbi:MAG: ROK family protein, partial [bacterium]